LDGLDVAILRELTQAQMVLPARPGIGPTNREISRKLKLPPATTRYRIRKMYASGVIRGSSILMNPGLLGLKYGAYVVDVSALLHKPAVVERLKRVEGTLFLHDFIDSLIWVGFLYENDQALSSKLEEIKEIAGAEGLFSRIPYPRCKASMNHSEAKLILHLLRGRFESYAGLASELGISIRTLQRTLSKLIEEGAVYSLPTVEYQKMSNCVPADLHVLFRDVETARASERTILPLVAEYLVFAALWDTLGMCSLILPDVVTMSRIVEKIRGVDGVAMARVDIVREHIDQASTLARYVERWMEGNGSKSTPPLQNSVASIEEHRVETDLSLVAFG
jgi:DNA-binding Lrp family transcriptional regulator